MKKIIFVVLGVCFLLLNNLFAEEIQKDETRQNTEKTDTKGKAKNAFQLNPNALGFNMNYPLTGGLTYHRWFDKFGLGITAGGIITRNAYVDYNIQLALQGMVFSMDINSWFSTGLYINTVVGHRGHSEYIIGGYPYNERSIKFRGYAGAGIGFEFLFLKHISVTTECMIVGIYPWEMTMGGGGGLKIRF